ncbi:MAG: discoidin domain-containing protein, partial [Anaerolineae bacterium]
MSLLKEMEYIMRKKLWLFLLGFLLLISFEKSPNLPPTVKAQDPSPENVALGKQAISSTIENSGYLPEYAVDGLENTRWSSQYADEQWLAVDLASVYAITQFTLKWEAAYGGEYELQAWDGIAWQTVVSEPSGDGGTDDITLLEAINARFVRMNGIKRATSWGYSLWEFEVYGTLAENPDSALENTPDIFTITETPIESTPIPTEEASVVSDGASEVRAIQSVTPLTSEVGLYEKFELEVTLDATFANPYDPIDILVEAQFEAP